MTDQLLERVEFFSFKGRKTELKKNVNQKEVSLQVNMHKVIYRFKTGNRKLEVVLVSDTYSLYVEWPKRLTLIMINFCTAMTSILTSLLWYCSNCTIYGFCKAVWFFFTKILCQDTYNENCRPSPYLLYEVKDGGETYM